MHTRTQIVSNLRQMRTDAEANRQLPFDMECMIFDFCAAIGLTEAETQSILGPAFFVVEEAAGDTEDYFNEWPG